MPMVVLSIVVIRAFCWATYSILHKLLRYLQVEIVLILPSIEYALARMAAAMDAGVFKKTRSWRSGGSIEDGIGVAVFIFHCIPI